MIGLVLVHRITAVVLVEAKYLARRVIMSVLKKDRDMSLLIVVIFTISAFISCFVFLANNIYVVYQNFFYIPVILSCFWFGRRGLCFSAFISITQLLIYLKYSTEPPWEEFLRVLVLISIALIIYKMADKLKSREAESLHINKALQNDIERFKRVEELSHLGSYEINFNTQKVTWSDELYKIFGFLPGSFEPEIDTRVELSHSDDRNLVKCSYEKAIEERSSFAMESRIIRDDGSVRWVLSLGYAELDEYGEADKFIGTLLDITESKKLEKSLAEEKDKLQITIASIGDGVISTDNNGYVTILNKVAEELTGWTQEEAIGKPIEKVFNIINEKTRTKCENPIQKVIESGLILGLANHTVLISRDGSEISIADSAAPIKDADGSIQGVILVFRDVSEEKRIQNEIYYMSYYDVLTGLYNRRFFDEEIDRIDSEPQLPISIIMGDVNGLKLTNDAFGHSEGDQLLKKAAIAIKGSCRACDIAARWGGDEFVVLLPKTRREEAEAVVNRIKNACTRMQTDSLEVSIALGFDTKESYDQDLLNILKNAEDYMYKNKVIESNSMRGGVINTISKTLLEKNPKVDSHSKRVSQLCQQIGRALSLPEMEIQKLKVSGLLHDIGKIAIDESILDKSGPLTEQEWIKMKRHPEIAFRILSSSPEMAEISQLILSHHEKYDGTGYPKGLKQDAIPLLSRIISVADSYDAMVNERAYKKVLSKDMAIVELIKNRGSQFDPYVVDLFIENVL